MVVCPNYRFFEFLTDSLDKKVSYGHLALSKEGKRLLGVIKDEWRGILAEKCQVIDAKVTSVLCMCVSTAELPKLVKEDSNLKFCKSLYSSYLRLCFCMHC